MRHPPSRLAGKLMRAFEPIAQRQSRAVADAWHALEKRLQLLVRRTALVALAHDHSWDKSLHRLRIDLIQQVHCVPAIYVNAFRELKALGAEPSIRHWTQELAQLDDDFQGYEIDWKGKSLSVETDPIELKNVSLGRFAIRLYWDRLREQGIRCFDVEALDPNPATSNSNITHPHLNDTALCIGEAQEALELALGQGRLVDAFCLIRGVLENYNPRSAYVSLADWNGTHCTDCGDFASDDCRWVCVRCGDDLCDDCALTCEGCGDTSCRGCQETCGQCERSFCKGCLNGLPNSDARFCPTCVKPCRQCGQSLASAEDDDEGECCSLCGRVRFVASTPDSVELAANVSE